MLGLDPTMSSPLHFAYAHGEGHSFIASELTRGPWHPDHQHAGPPSALVCRAIERAAAADGLTHLGRLTGNLLRPVPIGECHVDVAIDYVGRNAGHYSAQLYAGGKEVARFTALMQREVAVVMPDAAAAAAGPVHPPPSACPDCRFPFGTPGTGYGALVENRLAAGRFFEGPCAAWFRLRHPLVQDEAPSPYQRVAVAADSGTGISAALDFREYSFVNCDLTINLLRPPRGQWVCLDARTTLCGSGSGLAESALYDEWGLIGRATQTLAVRKRS